MHYPKPREKTKCRIFGPWENRHGMNVYSIYDMKTRKKICPDVMTYDEAVKRADDYVHGRVTVWMGHIPFKKVPIGQTDG